ncbi:MAG: hypothetical protein V4642_09885 [Bacteroidota bacterium]
MQISETEITVIQQETQEFLKENIKKVKIFVFFKDLGKQDTTKIVLKEIYF